MEFIKQGATVKVLDGDMEGELGTVEKVTPSGRKALVDFNWGVPVWIATIRLIAVTGPGPVQPAVSVQE